MTGYGEASRETPRLILAVELRTVNNRFLKIISKVPEEVSFLQNHLEERLRRRIVRGSIFLTVRFELTDSSELYEVDEVVVKKYLATLERLKDELGRPETVPLKDLLLLPGAVRSEESLVPEKEEILPVALDALDEALDKLIAMRELEGTSIREDLSARAKRLAELLAEIRTEAPRTVDEHFRRLEQRVRSLLGERQAALAPEDIVREVAIIAERSDISEEIARMESHIGQFNEALQTDQAIGRKLEFIAQEMFREANTIGSKSMSSELSRSAVDLKAEVDRVKEQVMNVE